jgi:hypothetical protein
MSKPRTYLDVPTPDTKEFVVVSIHDPDLMREYRRLVEKAGAAVMETNRFDEFHFLSLYTSCFLRLIDEETLVANKDLLRTHLDCCFDLDPFVVVGKDIELPFRHNRLLRLQDLSWDWVLKTVREGQEYDRNEIDRYNRAMREFE